MGLGLSLGQRWEEQPGQNGDDGNDHQQFDEGKTGVNFWRFHDQKKRLGGQTYGSENRVSTPPSKLFLLSFDRFFSGAQGAFAITWPSAWPSGLGRV